MSEEITLHIWVSCPWHGAYEVVTHGTVTTGVLTCNISSAICPRCASSPAYAAEPKLPHDDDVG